MLKIASIIINIISLGLFGAFRNLIKSHIARNWPTCIGKLKHWDIQSKKMGKGTGTHIKRFNYSYTINQVEFEGTRVGFGFPDELGDNFGQKDFDDILKNAPVLKVYYSPKEPSESTLCVGAKGFHLIKIYLHLLFFIMILVIVFTKPT